MEALFGLFMVFLSLGIIIKLYYLSQADYPRTETTSAGEDVVVVVIDTVMLCWGIYILFG